jgi:hypothetical protein
LFFEPDGRPGPRREGEIATEVAARLAKLERADAEPGVVATKIARVVNLPKGQRLFRVHIDPAGDGVQKVFDHGDEVRCRFL